MKKSLLIGSLILIALFVAIGWWSNIGDPVPKNTFQESKAPSTLKPEISASKTAITDASSAEEAEETEKERMQELMKAGKMTEEEYDQWRFKKRIEEGEKSNVPVRFYGKVVDQMGLPVSDVKVKFIIFSFDGSVLRNTADQKRTELDLMTDIQGRFSVENQKGYSIQVETLEKETYQPQPYFRKGFDYDPYFQSIHTPDPNNPVIFKIWKKQGAENIIHHQKNIRIPYDGTPIIFDLSKGKKVNPGEIGDLRVTLRRTPLQIERGKQKYDWIATIDAIDGGVIESKDDFMNLAPENGYEPGLEIKMLANDPNWKPNVTVPIYLKSRGGKHYGRVTLEFRTGSDRDTTGFTITSYINPAESRNLEYDRNTEIEVRSK
jgi:hypothetical protein